MRLIKLSLLVLLVLLAGAYILAVAGALILGTAIAIFSQPVVFLLVIGAAIIAVHRFFFPQRRKASCYFYFR